MKIKAGDTQHGWDSMLSAEEERRRKKLYDCGFSDPEIAAFAGVTPQSIRHWRRRRGYEANRNPHADAARHRRILLHIVMDADEPLRTGEVHEQYSGRVNDVRSKRRVLDLLKRHEERGIIRSTLEHFGRHGRSRVWRAAPTKTQTE